MITKSIRFKRKIFGQNLFFPILLAFLILLIIGFLISTNLKINRRRSELISQIETLKKEIQTLEEKNVNLKAEISQQGEEHFLEEKIREQGYKKPGEEVVAIKKIEAEKVETEKEKSFFQNWWEWLKAKLGE